MRLLLWADQHGGWKVFGSSSGFRLPDGSVLSPAASLVALDRWQRLNWHSTLVTQLNAIESQLAIESLKTEIAQL